MRLQEKFAEMEACSSETSVNKQTTRCHATEGNYLHNHRCEGLTSDADWIRSRETWILYIDFQGHRIQTISKDRFLVNLRSVSEKFSKEYGSRGSSVGMATGRIS
jgi:hypothetical protein